MMSFARLARPAAVLLLLATARAQVSAPAADPWSAPLPARVFAPAAPVAPAAPGFEGLRLLSADGRGVEFELVIGPLELEPGQAGMAVRASGADRLALPGEPDLPGREVLIGLPRTGGVRIAAEGREPVWLTGVTVRPATGFDGRATRAEAARAGLTELAELREIMLVRGVRVARVRLNPVRYDPAGREVSGFRRLKVTARFEQEPGPDGAPDRFDPVLEQTLLNGFVARAWKTPDWESGTGGHAAAGRNRFFDRSTDWCKVRTESTGVYRVRGSDLAAAGYDLDAIDPATLTLYSPGTWEMNGPYPDTMFEVPVLVQAASPDRFGPDDYVAFYAESPSTWRADDAGDLAWETNFFTRYRPWWLTWGGAPGRRFPELPAGGATAPRPTVPTRVRLEQDRLCPARSGRLWLWERYFKPGGVPSAVFALPLDLPGRDSVARISGRLHGVRAETDPAGPFLVRFRFDGQVLDSVSVKPVYQHPLAPADFSFAVPGPARAGPDTLFFELVSPALATAYLDWLELTGRARPELSPTSRFVEFGFDSAGSHEFAVADPSGRSLLLEVTDPFRPRRLAGTVLNAGRREARLVTTGPARVAGAFLDSLRVPVSVERRTPGRLPAAPGAAEYVVVSPDEFLPAARLFARHRDGNVPGLPGARARAVGLSDAYDDFAFGVEEPGALKSLFATWRPVFGLFAGDGTYDYRNCLGRDYPPLVPAYQVGFDVDPEVYGNVAKAYDAWYADFEGGGSSPDMVLGRITARSSVELRQYLDKVRTYETQPPGPWARRFLLLADDEFNGTPSRPDPIGFAHIRDSEAVYALARDRLDPVKVYLTEYPLRAINDKPEARAELYERLDQGALFWNFFGHGAGFQLTHERVLYIEGIPEVGGGSRNPVAFFGSCGVGRFDDTRYESVAEELVRKPDGGCIATVAATKATFSGPNARFARDFFSAMLAGPAEPAGRAFFAAWFVNTDYNYFGDPALSPRVPLPGPPVTVTPDSLYPGRAGSASCSIPGPGMYALAVRELDWSRFYRSEVGSLTYVLPGYRVHSGLGSFPGSRLDAGFLVPTLDYPDTVIVGNGSYARLPGTGAVSLLAWDDGRSWSSGRTDLELGPAQPGTDTRPPALRLFAGTTELLPGDTVLVPAEFTLRGELEDASGLLVAPDPVYGLALSVLGSRTQERVELHHRFEYDLNSATRGSFARSCRLASAPDTVSLTVIASDNYRNRLAATYHVRTGTEQVLRLDSALVWPNPVQGEARFTFLLNQPATVSLKIYTISGRLLRQLPPAACGFGYNQLPWDGRDADANLLPNGIYLYKLDARITGTGSAVSVRDKFIVFR